MSEELITLNILVVFKSCVAKRHPGIVSSLAAFIVTMKVTFLERITTDAPPIVGSPY